MSRPIICAFAAPIFYEIPFDTLARFFLIARAG